MKNRFTGVLLATLFGILGSIPWIIIGYFGWIASLGGYLIGLAAYKGYIMGNGIFDRFGKICIAIIILLVIPAAEMVNLFIAFLQQGIFFMDAAMYTPSIFLENITEFVPSILIGYVMAGLGTFQFFTAPSEERTI